MQRAPLQLGHKIYTTSPLCVRYYDTRPTKQNEIFCSNQEFPLSIEVQDKSVISRRYHHSLIEVAKGLLRVVLWGIKQGHHSEKKVETDLRTKIIGLG